MLAARILVDTTAQPLYDLLRGLDETGSVGTIRYNRPQEGFAEIRFQNENTGTDTVYIGDQAVTAGVTGNYGASLTNAATIATVQFGHDAADLNTRTIWLVASADNTPIHVWLR